MWYSVIIKKIEHLECSPCGYLRFNLLCCFDSGYTVKSIHNILNQNLINKICKCKVGDIVNLKLRLPTDFDWYNLYDKPDFVCEDLSFYKI